MMAVATKAPAAVEADLWRETVGTGKSKVTVMEYSPRGRALYLRWRIQGNWRLASLAPELAQAGYATPTLFDEFGVALRGRELERKKRFAIGLAEAHFAKLRTGTVAEKRKSAPLTLGNTWAIISDADSGKYPVDTPHRREVERELKHAARILGSSLPWEEIRRAELTKLARTRIREIRAKDPEADGLRGAEITVARLLAVAQWLRDHRRIPVDACVASSSWKKDLRADWLLLAGADRVPIPNRPRHEVDEFRKLLPAAWLVDPRFGLLLALGAELRGGQVKRARRSDLDLEANTFVVPGMGNKTGTTVKLTPGQRASVDRALAGYLAPLEAAYQGAELRDYFLFFSGQMPGGRAWARGRPSRADAPPSWRAPDEPIAVLARHGTAKPVTDYALRQWMRRAEAKAQIEHVPGRSLYGLRRVSVDGAKKEKISREGLQAFGGWTDSQVPDRVYADQQMGYAQQEAADVRARFRGEEEEPK